MKMPKNESARKPTPNSPLIATDQHQPGMTESNVDTAKLQQTLALIVNNLPSVLNDLSARGDEREQTRKRLSKFSDSVFLDLEEKACFGFLGKTSGATKNESWPV